MPVYIKYFCFIDWAANLPEYIDNWWQINNKSVWQQQSLLSQIDLLSDLSKCTNLQLFVGYLTVECPYLLLALLVQPLRHVFEVLDSTFAHKAPFSKHFTGSKQHTCTQSYCTHTHMQMPPCGFFTSTVKLKFWQADKIFYSTIAVFIYLYEPKRARNGLF